MEYYTNFVWNLLGKIYMICNDLWSGFGLNFTLFILAMAVVTLVMKLIVSPYLHSGSDMPKIKKGRGE